MAERNHNSRKTLDALATEEQREEFCNAVVEHGSVRAACSALGLHHPSVFYLARKDADFGGLLTSAWAACLEADYAECKELTDQCPPDKAAVMKCRMQVDTRMRMIGKLLPAIYGERPNAQVNVQNNIGLVCTEETRLRLIDLREKLLAAGHASEPLALPQGARRIEIVSGDKPND